MEIAFTKMQGLGNDFVVIDKVRQTVALSAAQIRFIADRRFGVGCDQILLVEPPRDSLTDFYYRIFNADGGEVEQCGNGARCFARFVRDQGLSDTNEIDVGTANGSLRLFIESDGQVRVNMGPPRFAPEEIPFLALEKANAYPLAIAGETFEIGAVSMGNPHAVLTVDDVGAAPVLTLGSKIERHPRFPNRSNVGFMQVIGPSHIALRVFERGVGETLACGTGACAAVAVGRLRGQLDERVKVDLSGGQLMVSWAGDNQPVWMIGPATRVFDGRITL